MTVLISITTHNENDDIDIVIKYFLLPILYNMLLLCLNSLIISKNVEPLISQQVNIG